MKIRNTIFVLVCLLSAVSARAQNTIAVSASHIQGLSGTLLVSGSLCFQGTDQNNKVMAFQQGGGGPVVTTALCTAITNGVISAVNVPNPAATTPLNIRYHITVVQGARTVADFPGAYLCNATGACTSPYTFNFDNCLSTGACNANPIPMTTGPKGDKGDTGSTGSTGAPGVLTSNSGIDVGGSASIMGPDPHRDVNAYGAPGVPLAFQSGAIFHSGSTTLVIDAAHDLKNGQTLRLTFPNIGDLSPTTAPTGLALTYHGVAGAVTRQYQIACVDSKWGESAANSVVTVGSTASTLMYDSSFANANYVHVAWSAPASNCVYKAVYGRTSGSMQLLGITANNRWEDYGQANMSVDPGLATTPPGAATRGYYYGKIVSGAGTTTLTMDTAAAIDIAATAQLERDDSAGIQAAYDAAAVPLFGLPSGTQDNIHFSPGTYYVTQPIHLAGGITPELMFEGTNMNSVVLQPLTPGMDLFLVQNDNQDLTWSKLTILPSVSSTSSIHYVDAAVEALRIKINQVRMTGDASTTFFATDVNTILETWADNVITSGVNYRYGEPALPIQLDDIHIGPGFFGTPTGCGNGDGNFQMSNVGSTGGVRWKDMLLEGPGQGGCTHPNPWFRYGGSGIQQQLFDNVEFAPEAVNTTGTTFAVFPGTIATGGLSFHFSPISSIGSGSLFDFTGKTGNGVTIFLDHSNLATGGAQVFKNTNDNNGIHCVDSTFSPTLSAIQSNGDYTNRGCSGFLVSGISLDRIDYPVSTTTNLLERNDSTGANLFVIENSGDIKQVEAAAPSGTAGFDKLYADSTAHRLVMKNNNGAAQNVGAIVASGTSALGTGAISATTCATVVTTSATGSLSTDAIEWSFNAVPSTGYASGVHVLAYPTADNVNFLVCNPTAGSLTPAAATLNWKVIR